MTTRAYSLDDIDRAIAAENERHKKAIEKLQGFRANFAELDELIQPTGGGGGGLVRRIPASERIIYDPAEYGGKKRLFLRLIAASESGLGSGDTMIKARAAGLSDVKIENVTPYLSSLKGDGLLVMDGTRWCITQKGRDLLAQKN